MDNTEGKVAHSSGAPSTGLKPVKLSGANLISAVVSGDSGRLGEMERGLSPEKALQGSHLRDYSGRQAIKGLLLLLMRTVNFFNVGKGMNKAQAMETCDLLYEEYPHESLEDFAVCFRNARKGVYGTVYDRIDGGVVFGWVRQYMEEKSLVREKVIGEQQRAHQRAREKQFEQERSTIAEAYKRLRKEPWLPPGKKAKATSDEEYRAFRQRYIAEKLAKHQKNKP
ncbi:hypothetical protein FUAX_43620 (plasmid) [Fulvitalea axinellae]|uniref:Uncharacterized protein n=1 Tax=Fulvitalea axinellae TaxID=1182444 RepID=A0AAU9CRB5_9BACT|nr:hypothetical protein FUAX_43620 [Fulvitalea axinellae]